MAEIHPETELIPYLRGELSADERARVGAHLEGCAQCRASADASSAILTSLARVVDEVRDPDWTAYRAELTRKLRARQAGSATLRGRWRSRRADLRLPVFGWPSMALGTAAVAVLAIAADALVASRLADADWVEVQRRRWYAGSTVGSVTPRRVASVAAAARRHRRSGGRVEYASQDKEQVASFRSAR